MRDRSIGLWAAKFIFVLATLPAHAAQLALVNDNDIYQQVSTLKDAGNDAKLMVSSAVCDVSVHFKLDRKRTYEAIDGIQKCVGKGDEVVFYFPGHCVKVESAPLLLPTVIQTNDERDLERDALPLLHLKDAFKVARVSLLVIDDCRGNPFPNQGTRSIGDAWGMRPLHHRSNVIGFSSVRTAPGDAYPMNLDLFTPYGKFVGHAISRRRHCGAEAKPLAEYFFNASIPNSATAAVLWA